MDCYAEDFDQGSALASMTTQKKCSVAVRGKGVVLINNRPCKVVSFNTCSPGKHGHAKASYVGIDIFTGKKHEGCTPCHHNVEVPIVNKKEYVFSYLDRNGYVSMIGDNGVLRSDLKVAGPEEGSDDVGTTLRTLVNEDKNFVVVVLSCMGEEKIIGCKTTD